MARITVENLSFRYPQAERLALEEVSLDVRAGDYVVVCGKSACGKSTLLHHLKTVLTPHGESSGRVLLDGQPLGEIPLSKQASRIGFVLQNPDAQLVTDKVWHELAFGLENLACDQQAMRLRVAEMASYFGIQSWFDRSVNELSGGQKQLLNLASIMVMQPEVLILDEPTSQLDPIAASDFLNTVLKINRDMGVTVIISEHRLEELLPYADMVVVMEGGRIAASGTPREVGDLLFEHASDMRYALPTPMRVYGECALLDKGGTLGEADAMPVTVREGRMWLSSLAGEGKRGGLRAASKEAPCHGDAILEARDLWHRYDRNSPDVLRGANLSVRSGRILALVGGNGAGKTSMLRALAGVVSAYRGKISLKGTRRASRRDLAAAVALLPQNPQDLFSGATVRQELLEMLPGGGALGRGKPQSEACADEHILEMASQFEIAHLLDAHPYDLSGGEQQRVALAKLLMRRPQVLLLDEPTKGIDAFFKRKLALLLKGLAQQGAAVVLVSHDLEFCAQYADDAALIFNGEVVSEGLAHDFFAGSSFYTTAANRMSRHLVEGLVTAEEVIAYVR